MTTWLQTPRGEDVYVVTLTHEHLRLTWRALVVERDAADRAAAALTAGGHRPDSTRLLALRVWSDQLTMLADQFDPAKVRADALEAHGGPLRMRGVGDE